MIFFKTLPIPGAGAGREDVGLGTCGVHSPCDFCLSLSPWPGHHVAKVFSSLSNLEDECCVVPLVWYAPQRHCEPWEASSLWLPFPRCWGQCFGANG